MAYWLTGKQVIFFSDNLRGTLVCGVEEEVKYVEARITAAFTSRCDLHVNGIPVERVSYVSQQLLERERIGANAIDPDQQVELQEKLQKKLQKKLTKEIILMAIGAVVGAFLLSKTYDPGLADRLANTGLAGVARYPSYFDRIVVGAYMGLGFRLYLQIFKLLWLQMIRMMAGGCALFFGLTVLTLLEVPVSH